MARTKMPKAAKVPKIKRETSVLETPPSPPSSTKAVPVTTSTCHVLRVWANTYKTYRNTTAWEFRDDTFKVGDRLFLQEWSSGGPTGVARLCAITGLSDGLTLVEYTWGWSRDALLDSVVSLGYGLSEKVFPVFGSP